MASPDFICDPKPINGANTKDIIGEQKRENCLKLEKEEDELYEVNMPSFLESKNFFHHFY